MDEFSGLAAHWVWFIAAAIFAIGEIAVAPGIFLIFIAGAATCLGIITAVVTVSLPLQLIAFGILSVSSVYLGRKWYQHSDVSNEDPMLNNRAARMIGEAVTVTEPLTAASGRVRLGDSDWPARGENLPVGAIGRISAVESGVLMIEPDD